MNNRKNNNYKNTGMKRSGYKKKKRWNSAGKLTLAILVLAIASVLLLLFGNRLPWNKSVPRIELSQLIGEEVPEYTDSPYAIIGDNVPDEFSGGYDKNAAVGVSFSSLDGLGRCGPAEGVLSYELMPQEERTEMLETKPSGWKNTKYDDLIEDGFLYNRCHLIGYQLTGENDNELNLITGTRYFNVEGMLPFENRVAYYLRREEGKVFYRVTPIFIGDELVARYVRMEAFSLYDNGSDVSFDVLIYNVQPGIEIDYKTGDSRAK